MKNKTVCFTGHRPQSLGGFNDRNPLAQKIKVALKKVVSELIDQGFTEFISGGALGVDQWAAEIVIEFKKNNPELKLHIAKPFPSQELVWPEESKQRFNKICQEADEIVAVCKDPYAAWKMQKRNEFMIDNSSVLVAVFNGTEGGTANAINYGEKVGIKIIKINPIYV